MSKNHSHLSGRQGLDNNLFEAYAKAAEAQGSPSLEDLEKLRDEFLVGKSSVFGAVSFYDFLRPENRGKKVYVCNGSACLTAGTQHKLKDQLLTHYSEDEIGEMCCLGRCHENNAFHTGQVNYSGGDIHNLVDIKSDKLPSTETYHVGFSGTSLLTAPTGDVGSYYKTFARVLEKGEILSEIKTSALRGRGGAGFPISFKLEACANQTADTKFIVCNADEGDPGAYSDRYIMEQKPHALILGMLIAGFAAKARYGVVYIRAEYPESVTIVQNAIEEARSLGWIGENIMGSGFSFDFKVIKAQGAYICGEETALLSSIEGQRPEVRTRPPYPVQQGLFNQPTVVNNVETLACLPWIAENGGAAYAAIGTEKSKGTKLVSLDGHFNRPGIYEVDMGTPLSTVVNELGQGFRHGVKAMHIGGPLGGLVPVHKINELTVDFESFASNGFLLGHASVVCIPDTFPMIEYIEHLFRFTAHESCGKCFPCRLGSTRGYEMIDKSRNTAYKIDRTLLDDLLETMEVGSLCALGGGLPLPIKNALQYFEEELKPYFKA
ncbi:MAG: NADH-ubiquinone oxidoreductase-F iron-sulfur binding region domain-containing protein [Saprospiraceae bacterium]